MADPLPRPKAQNATIDMGMLAAESLFVTFDFSRNDLLAASAHYQSALRAGTPVEMPSEIKTWVHELTHYIHYTTTPYGLFLQYCRKLQSQATGVMVQALVDAGIAFHIPLLSNLPDLKGDIATSVNRGLSMWLNIENLLAMMNGDTEKRLELMKAFQADVTRVEAGQTPQHPPLLDIHDAFVRIQESMADFLEHLNQEARAAGNQIPMQPEGFDRQALQEEQTTLPSADTRALMNTEFGLDVLGNPYNVEAIIESAATAAEFWGSPVEWDAFVAWIRKDAGPELQMYRTCLEQALGSIQTRSVREFLPSYITICELAFFSPVLPHHAALRRQHTDFREILPVARWTSLLQVAARVAPMTDLGDHDRYVTDLCRSLGWVHPLQIIKVAIDGPGAFTDPLASIYLWAQKWRARSGASFIGLNRFLFDPSPLGEDWRASFNFVILDYTDRTTYHPNKSFVEAMTTRYLQTLGMQCIMMSKKLTISAPYRGNEAERQWMTDWLRAYLKNAFGGDFSMLRFI
jgi:hypothetical protein